MPKDFTDDVDAQSRLDAILREGVPLYDYTPLRSPPHCLSCGHEQVERRWASWRCRICKFTWDRTQEGTNGPH